MPFSMTGMSSIDMLRSTTRRLAASALSSTCPRLAGASACRQNSEPRRYGRLAVSVFCARDKHVRLAYAKDATTLRSCFVMWPTHHVKFTACNSRRCQDPHREERQLTTVELDRHRVALSRRGCRKRCGNDGRTGRVPQQHRDLTPHRLQHVCTAHRRRPINRASCE